MFIRKKKIKNKQNGEAIKAIKLEDNFSPIHFKTKDILFDPMIIFCCKKKKYKENHLRQKLINSIEEKYTN